MLDHVHHDTVVGEVLRDEALHREACAVHSSAGYFAGWCSSAFGSELQARARSLIARVDARCELVMAPAARFHEHEARAKTR